MIKGLSITKQSRLADVQKIKDGTAYSVKIMFNVKMENNGMCFSLNVNVQLDHFGMALSALKKFHAKMDKFLMEKMDASVLKVHTGMINGVR